MNISNWATLEEFKEKLEGVNLNTGVQKSGIPIAYDDENLYIDNTERHNLIIGSTGSGKTQSVILPMIKLSIMAGETFLVNDPRGELYERVASKLKEEKYNTIVLDFNDPLLGNSWNPLTFPYKLYREGNIDKSLELIEDIAYYIFKNEESKNTDPFWINSVINYFTGITLFLFENAKEEEINLTSIGRLGNILSDKNESDKLLKMIPESNNIKLKLLGILKAPVETKGSIISVFNQKIERYLTRKNLENMLSKTDFDISKINQEKVAIFVVSGIASVGKSLNPLLANQIMESVFIYGKSKNRINLLLDEFDTMIPMKDFAEKLNYSRGLNIRVTICIQSYVHLFNMYSKEETEILKMCFGNTIYLLSEDSYTLEEISSRCGMKYQNKEEVPLISISELKTLNPFEAIVLTTRMLPLKTKLLPDYQMDWGYKTKEETIPTREFNKIQIYEFGK